MKSLHIAPGDSAGGTLRQALSQANCRDDVAVFLDDLSCGPISFDDAATRAAWWAKFYPGRVQDHEKKLASFWDCLRQDRRLVVWIGRRSASEFAFLHAFADRLQQRSFDLMDVTDLRFAREPGHEPGRAVAFVSSDELSELVGTERTVAPAEQQALVACWRSLKAQNSPFRVSAESGLVSVGDDYFDTALLSSLTAQPAPVNRVILYAMSHKLADLQVGDVMLAARLADLVRRGLVEANGDVQDRLNCSVWLLSVSASGSSARRED